MYVWDTSIGRIDMQIGDVLYLIKRLPSPGDKYVLMIANMIDIAPHEYCSIFIGYSTVRN